MLNTCKHILMKLYKAYMKLDTFDLIITQKDQLGIKRFGTHKLSFQLHIRYNYSYIIFRTNININKSPHLFTMYLITYCDIFYSLDIKYCVFSLVGQSTDLTLFHFSYIAYNLKSLNLSVHEHVHGRKTTKFHSHEIK